MVFKYPMKDVNTVHIDVFDATQTDVDGQPIKLKSVDVKCTITTKGKLVEQTDGKQVRTVATIFKKGNLFDDIEHVTGNVILDGQERPINYFHRVMVPNKEVVHHIEIGVE